MKNKTGFTPLQIWSEKNMRKFVTGFTLIELMVVVIIIGILATIAIPSFNKSMENARAREARATLELIYNAEKIYRLDKKSYTAANGTDDSSWVNLTSYIENPNNTAQYYNYVVNPANATSFTAKATRNDGSGKIMTITQTGQITE